MTNLRWTYDDRKFVILNKYTMLKDTRRPNQQQHTTYLSDTHYSTQHTTPYHTTPHIHAHTHINTYAPPIPICTMLVSVRLKGTRRPYQSISCEMLRNARCCLSLFGKRIKYGQVNKVIRLFLMKGMDYYNTRTYNMHTQAHMHTRTHAHTASTHTSTCTHAHTTCGHTSTRAHAHTRTYNKHT